jgi:hypothetical protein
MTMRIHRVVLAASAAILLGLSVGGASAMPLDGLKPATEGVQATENVAWVCGPYRCWWRPGYRYYGPRAYGFYGPRRYGWYGHRRWW